MSLRDRLRRLFGEPTEEELRDREERATIDALAARRRIEAAAARIEAAQARGARRQPHA